MLHKILSFYQLSFHVLGQDLFNSLSVSFFPSTIVHIKGKNGCGKSSLLKIIAGIQKPTNGFVYFGTPKRPEEQSLLSQNHEKPYCVYVGHRLGLKSELTVLENLKFWSEIYNSPEAFEASIYYFNLQHILNTKCYELSRGNQQKVALSKLLSCQASLWLLDEVESNLDQQNKELLHNLIALKANNGGIIVNASHGESIKTAQILNLDEQS
ncbi:Heme ABC exporter ATP-binding protein CcmA [Candidatus Trichorickettsia mobilis]|uniref:Heme ABC exporter ATP-binding protein CcmA n=1 Tax=Candidatus Trichorickettsia mobilis TaxID=1346319 RepID=A0ABZ0USE9_9RICK|nr:Heme ABC exporter ATP-binding protein CcmA [Candidatus Trichorickettsia mobilis]